ncbi:GPI mannosyltransferase 1 isoform X1 [Hydra vulgaris]|uniref:GPI mannosyltransferase 1 isoform X1 n=1 Tax=Hydra vulgaris TaxID=6087 RepID=UPI0032E9DF03
MNLIFIIVRMEKNILVIASLIRVFLILYSTFHDKYFEVKYTDIDYEVFTQAAKHLVDGGSPYLKDTYKYTPMLAYLMIPNVFLHILFGKFFFCVLDIIVAILLHRILNDFKISERTVTKTTIVCFWLFNPFTMTISSRGNAESVQMVLVLLALYFLMKDWYLYSAVFFGLSVHFKLYSIIYVVPFLLKIQCSYNVPLYQSRLKNGVYFFLKKRVILFSAVSFGTFVFCGLIMFMRFGMEFIENTYFFHIFRVDIQHNFSFYFYPLKYFKNLPYFSTFKSIAFLPQLVTVVWLGFKYSAHLPFACFLQTFAFVSLNKVCTSQYFIWYIVFLPLVCPYLQISFQRAIVIIISWLLGQIVWLFLAYLLEFKKYDVELYVWMASCLFLCINVGIIHQIIRAFSLKQRSIIESKKQ